MRLLPATLCVAVAGCASPDEPLQGPSIRDNRLLVFIPDARMTVLRTAQSGLVDPTLSVVSDQPSWTRLWAAARTASDSAVPPSIDFVFYSVVAVGLGRRSGAGYSVTVDSVVAYLDGSVVYATEAHSSATCGGSGTAQPPGAPSARAACRALHRERGRAGERFARIIG